jgi:hypothetical protein
MTTGIVRFADISTYVNNILEGSIETLRAAAVLVSTIRVFNDTNGMNPRKVYQWGTTTPRAAAEGEDVTPEQFEKSLLQTLTPSRVANQLLMTDERINTDWDNYRAEAANELGMSFAQKVDTDIAGLFSSLTGGTIGAVMGTIGWLQIHAARAILQQKKIPGPYFCAIGAGMWYHLAVNGGTAITSTFMRSPAFQDRVINNYFITSIFGDVTFVVTPNISGGAGGTAYGAVYSPLAMAYDERTPFTIETERDSSRGAWELNANLRYAKGVWDSVRGVQLIGTDVIPTT